jgi:hypothetical protein
MMSYQPCVNDYVVWTRGIEGWVYFKHEEYITIETDVWKKVKRTMSSVQYTEMIEYWFSVIITSGMN